MAQQFEDECPVCHDTLPRSADGSNCAGEAHITSCIDSHLSKAPIDNKHSSLPPAKMNKNLPVQNSDDDECPVCHTSWLSQEFDGNIAAREAHVSTCIELVSSSPAPNGSYEPPPYPKPEKTSSNRTGLLPPSTRPSKGGPSKADVDASASSSRPTGSTRVTRPAPTLQQQEDKEVGGLRKWFSKLGVDSKTPDEKRNSAMTKSDERMCERWGLPESPRYELVMRYWVSTRMRRHWEYLHSQHPRAFKRYLGLGYMEPIPTSWVQSQYLAWPLGEFSFFENRAEARLYYLLNNGVLPDGTKPSGGQLRPLNINRDYNTIIRRGNARNARQQHLDAKRLAAYGSPADVFMIERGIESRNYSDQVPNTVYAARTQALHELADGILHGTDHLETMLLLDVSGSMTWNPKKGVRGPDGMTRYHDQPSNISLVEHLVHRCLHHMVPRAQKEHAGQLGIDTVTFSSRGYYKGQLTSENFRYDWLSKVRLGGGTQVMQGWQAVKQTYFQHQHNTYGHGRFDQVFGWQPTPGMPKLSLLVFLDGEAADMDEFELELLGETWAYVTIALVGMENCPHHHSHAIELERVAKFNPHVGFFDVHGRVCERMVVEDLLSSVYPVDPPTYTEILKPEFDLKADELPAYSAQAF